jgi:ubiquinone biosynthesis protein
MNIGLRELSGAFHIPKGLGAARADDPPALRLLLAARSRAEPVAIIQPYLQDFVLGNRDFTQIAMEAIRDVAMSAVTLPEDMRRYLIKANRGELEIRVRGMQEGAQTVYAAVRQLIYTAVALAAGFEAIESWRRHEWPMARGLYAVAIGAATLLLLSSVFARPRRR